MACICTHTELQAVAEFLFENKAGKGCIINCFLSIEQMRALITVLWVPMKLSEFEMGTLQLQSRTSVWFDSSPERPSSSTVARISLNWSGNETNSACGLWSVSLVPSLVKTLDVRLIEYFCSKLRHHCMHWHQHSRLQLGKCAYTIISGVSRLVLRAYIIYSRRKQLWRPMNHANPFTYVAQAGLQSTWNTRTAF